MLRDFENVEDVNKQLERLGYNMGMRIIEDFLSKTNSSRCLDMRDTADKIQSAFRWMRNQKEVLHVFNNLIILECISTSNQQSPIGLLQATNSLSCSTTIRWRSLLSFQRISPIFATMALSTDVSGALSRWCNWRFNAGSFRIKSKAIQRRKCASSSFVDWRTPFLGSRNIAFQIVSCAIKSFVHKHKEIFEYTTETKNNNLKKTSGRLLLEISLIRNYPILHKTKQIYFYIISSQVFYNRLKYIRWNSQGKEVKKLNDWQSRNSSE